MLGSSANNSRKNFNGALAQRLGVVVALTRSWYSVAMILKIFAYSLLLLPLGSSAEGAVENQGYVMCRSQKVVRTIRVVADEEGCQTVYTKAGIDRIVGNAKSRNSCVDVMKNIRGNLEGASWKCKDISTATFSEVKE